MKTLLLTAYNSAMAPIGDLTAPLMRDYAKKHGFDFLCTQMETDLYESYWQKIWEIGHWMNREQHDRFLWLDADQVITNPEWAPPWTTGFHASMDWGRDAVDIGQFSACGFVICRDMVPLLNSLTFEYEAFKEVPFPEQTAMRAQFIGGGEWKYRMRTHPRRVFNAVPKEISEDAPEPWQPGDWCCHLTHVEPNKRAELFHEIRRQAA